MSVPEEAERLWSAIKDNDIAVVREVLEEALEDNDLKEKIKEICEYEVNVLVFEKDPRHRRDGLSCIHYASKKGGDQVLACIFELVPSANINLQTNILGWSPLHYSISAGHVRASRVLHLRNIDINLVSKKGQSALHMSLERGYFKMANWLLRRKCEANLKDEKGRTALALCLSADFLMISNWNDEQLIKMVDALLSHGTDPRIQDLNGNNAVHLAILSLMNKDIVTLLLDSEHGKETLSMTNNKGQTPLFLVQDVCQAELLLKKGVDLNITCTQEKTVLHSNITNVELMKLYLDKNANPNIADSQGKLPIHLAVGIKFPSLRNIKTLIDAKSKLEHKDKSGNTPLHTYCLNINKSYEKGDTLEDVDETSMTKDHDPVLELLLEKGSGVIDFQNENGETPLVCCMKKKSFTKAAILLKHNANPNIADKNGNLPQRIDPIWFANNYKDPNQNQSSNNVNTPRSDGTPTPASLLAMTITSEENHLNNKHPASTQRTQESPLPKWVCESTSKTESGVSPKPKTPRDLQRQMTSLHNEVNEINTFLDEFSKESDSKKVEDKKTRKKTPQSLQRQISNLQTEVNEVKELLEEVSTKT